MIQDQLILSYYGDDFTGPTDVMESLSLNGIPTALFLHAPSPEEVTKFRLKNVHVCSDGKLQAFGVAGISRSLTPTQMDLELPDIFKRISQIPTRYFHYKICSTFDSSPLIGNIGYATEIALRYFPSSFIPLIVGLPLLNRFCVFGNLFARVDDITYRLDRHPTMSKHPITPMHESDLRRHLGLQTKRSVHLVDVLHLQSESIAQSQFDLFSKQGGFILFDVLTTDHLLQIGKLIDEKKQESTQLLVGSSGVEYAMCYYGQQNGFIRKPDIPMHTKKATHYIIIAGSCSPGTAKQIEHGLSIGYSGIRMEGVRLVDNNMEEINRCTAACLEVLNSGGVPLLFSAFGPDDPDIEATKSKLKTSNASELSIGPILAGAQGIILKNVLDKTKKIRVTVAGGDTSGYVTKALGIYALEVLVPLAPGAPLCIAHAKNSHYDGLEIALKGGQNGNDRYFEFVQNGQAE